jgi:hypothetical protein
LKGESDGSSYSLGTGEYKFVFSLYLDGISSLKVEAEKNIKMSKTPFFESLDIDASPEGIFKGVTVIMGAAVLFFIALATATVVYRKKSEAAAAQNRLSRKTVLNDRSHDYERDGEYSKKKIYDEYDAKKTVLSDDGYDYLYEDEPTSVDYAANVGIYDEQPKHKSEADYNRLSVVKKEEKNKNPVDIRETNDEKNKGDVRTEKNKNAADIRETNDEKNRGFSYEQLIKEKKKFSLGESPAKFDGISENYASSGNGNALKKKLSKNFENSASEENKDEEN